ncbi:BamA/TamA family outer membrane protein [Ferrimonas gelatinilytica]|uniref:BamA/TamA family outer membrane protein n=1 Tax=Ferrimonas gelatinilytica TaxID=1255257 RepID=A0ABP9S1V0_9GAMM
MHKVLLTATALLSMPLQAQEPVEELAGAAPSQQGEEAPGMFTRLSAKMETLLENLGADGGFDPNEGMDWSVLPGPFYTPEMELGIGVSAVGLYVVDPEDQVSQISSLTINGFASINGALGAQILSQTFWREDKYRLFIDMEVVDAPEVFYGSGITAGRNEANRIDFDRRGYRLHPQFFARVFPSTYFGIGLEFGQDEADDLELVQPILSSASIPFPESSTTTAITAHVLFDSRDFILNPSEGRLLQADIAIYDTALGGDSDFDKLNLDYRDYWQLGPGILAWQVAAELNRGAVPWDKLAMLGGSQRLRGYESGRYRDRQMLLSQVEYRHHLAGRHGLVYWFGVGTLAEEARDLGREKWLHSLGFGYRFEVKQRVNLRLDMAFGNGDSGFYFSVNEAF